MTKNTRPKPVTPYERLLRMAKEWVDTVLFAHRRAMFGPMEAGSAWRLAEVWERTKAADQLGYDVVVVATGGDGSRGPAVIFEYRKRPPPPPFELQ